MTINKTILMMAGGTGGHVFPALAIAEALQNQGYKIEWLGTSAGIEADLVPKAGITLNTLTIHGLRGKGRLGLLSAPLKITRAILQALKIIRRIQPVAVVGLGGYATGPGGIAAVLSGIPLFIHEQNAFAGMTNRLLNRVTRHSMQAFPGALTNATVTGNPVRHQLLTLDRQQNTNLDSLKVLVVGGSLGAVALNDTVFNAMQQLAINERPQLTHQAGKRNYTELRQRYVNADINVDVCAFIDDMANAYKNADLIICRSGALTVSEVATVGIPAIFIPYPHAVDDHQTANAQFLVDAGAALICQQKDLTAEFLMDCWRKFAQQPELLQDMSNRARQVAKTDATQSVVSIIEDVIRDR